jgi:hypothetical protein
LILKFVDIRVNAGGNGSLPEISSTEDQTLFSSEREFQIPRKVEPSPFNRGSICATSVSFSIELRTQNIEDGDSKFLIFLARAHQSRKYLVSPRVEYRNAGGFEVLHISRNDSQPVNEGGRGDQCVSVGARVWYMQRCASLRDCCIHSENAIMEGWQYLSVHPGAKKLPLYRITAFNQEDSYLDFQNRDG